MAINTTPQHDPIPAADVSSQVSNLDALMIEASVTAGRGTLTVCGEDDAEAELVAVRPLAAHANAGSPGCDWGAYADAVIFGWLVSP
jgi:hypothetical protein